MSILLLIILLTPVISLNWVSEPRRTSTGLNGVQLTFAVNHNPPYDTLILRPDGNYTHTGSGPIWQAWLARKLNFTISYRYVMINQMIIDKFGGSALEYSVNLVMNKEADALVSGLVASPERKKKMDFSYFIWTELYSMVVPRAEEESRLLAFIRPFQSIVQHISISH
ncbi:uncharacterized protein LOC124196104 [Daphnia pulex]|uniref:uncharacterized protein LOC124196104 n=1 Tax=Daphnia pulex TaxID=6669 RepID=UPI001EDD576F|nr:uncharacterized protein LOC124196104 [Daphnia pulex]